MDSNKADDITQQVWLSALKSEAPPRRKEDLRPWLKVVANNALFLLHRSASRRNKYERKDPKIEAVFERSLAQQNEMRAILEQLIAELDEPYQSIVRLHFFDELSLAAIARKEKLPYGTVHTRLRRALVQLRDKLDRRFGGREAWTVMLVPFGSVARPRDGSATSLSGKGALGILAAAAALVLTASMHLHSTDHSNGEGEMTVEPTENGGSSTAAAVLPPSNSDQDLSASQGSADAPAASEEPLGNLVASIESEAPSSAPAAKVESHSTRERSKAKGAGSRMERRLRDSLEQGKFLGAESRLLDRPTHDNPLGIEPWWLTKSDPK